MSDRRRHGEQPVEALADEAIAENADRQTRRESFELELMDDDRSEEGEGVALDDVAEGRNSSDETR